jgi:hypothetical protein
MWIHQNILKIYSRFTKLQRDTDERKRFLFLPDIGLMKQAGYTERFVGDYYQEDARSLFRVSVLSQSGMFLFYRDEQLLKATVIGSDEELLRLIISLHFPFSD